MGSLLTGPSESETEAPASVLTRREIEISALVAQGLENSEISGHLCIAEVTVRTHFRRILRKLGLRNRVELTHHALANNWTGAIGDAKPTE